MTAPEFVLTPSEMKQADLEAVDRTLRPADKEPDDATDNT